MSTYPVKSWDPETRTSRGASFAPEHICPDQVRGPLHWERDDAGEDIRPRVWEVCDRCGYAVQLVIRHPR